MTNLPTRSELNTIWNREYLQIRPAPKRIRRFPMGICPGCGEEKRIRVRGLCRACYDRERYREKVMVGDEGYGR